MARVALSKADRTNALVGVAVGALGPIVVALILVPVRTELDNANLALILVLVVVIAAIIGGRRAGALAAIVATLSFDFFLTQPYLSLKIETSDDLETALILLGVGLLVGAVASRGRRSERETRARGGRDRPGAPRRRSDRSRRADRRGGRSVTHELRAAARTCRTAGSSSRPSST